MKRWISLLLGALLLFSGALADESPTPFEDSQLRRMVTLPTGKQMYYYAQNDPIWEKTRYEVWNNEGSRRTFGGGGCNPTALAMVIANMVAEEDLPRLAQHTYEGSNVEICPGSVTHYYCANHQEDETLVLTEPEQYKKLLPLAIGNYACKNNVERYPYRTGQGTRYSLFYAIAEIYGLTVTATRELDEAISTIENGGEVIILSGGTSQPFSQASGHYLVLGDADEEYLYLLDPYIVEAYTEDKKNILEKIEDEPGLLRMQRQQLKWLCVSYYFLFAPLQVDAAASS